LPLSGGRSGGLASDGLDEFLTLGQLAKRERFVRLRIGDLAVMNGQAAAIDAGLRSRQVKQSFTRCRGRAAKLRRHSRRRAASKGACVKWRQLRVRHDQPDAVERNG